MLFIYKNQHDNNLTGYRHLPDNKVTSSHSLSLFAHTAQTLKISRML